jgi:hypothetical protein
MHASHEALTLHSPVAHPGSPWLILLARCERLKRHGVGEREGELGADFTCLVPPSCGCAARAAQEAGNGGPAAMVRLHSAGLVPGADIMGLETASLGGVQCTLCLSRSQVLA